MKCFIILVLALIIEYSFAQSINDLNDVSSGGAASGEVLTYDASSGGWSPQPSLARGFASTLDNEVLFNDGDSIGGSSNLTWDDTDFKIIGALNPAFVSERSGTGAAYFKARNTTNEWQFYANGANGAIEPNVVNGLFSFRNLANTDLFRINTSSSEIIIGSTDNGAYPFQVNGNSFFSGNLNAASLPTYADDAAAGVGGLVAGDIYKTATGELRVKL